MNKNKAPGEDSINGKVFESAFDIIPKYISAMCNTCLRKGVFPKKWKTAKLIPIVKPGKEYGDEISKFTHNYSQNGRESFKETVYK